MAEVLEGTQLESTTVYLWRNSKVVKGGRRFSLSALVVVGDRKGSVGIGYGKAAGAPLAIEKAQKNARKKMYSVNRLGGTIPHPVIGRYCASAVKLIPAAPGTGVIAGGTVRAVLEMVGIQDCLTKAAGSTNQKNLVKATLDGLMQLRTRDQVASWRGVEIEASEVDEKLELGRKYMPKVSGNPVSKKLSAQPKSERGGRGGKGRGGRGGRGGGGGGGGGRGGRGGDHGHGGGDGGEAAAPAAEPSAPPAAAGEAPSA
jgi:small subunit ribosomal protein S5